MNAKHERKFADFVRIVTNEANRWWRTPSPERVRAAARRRSRAAMTVTAVAVLLIAGGTAVVVCEVTRQHPALGVARLPSEQVALIKARAIVGAVVVPPGSREVDSTPTPKLDEARITYGSPYVKSQTRFWTVQGTAAGVTAFFKEREENGQTVEGYGGVGTIFRLYGDLSITLAPMDAQMVGIRADSQVLWQPDKPASDRIPSGVQSVEVVADQFGVVLAHKTLTGPAAQHLADLVNSLELDIWAPRHCPMDLGRRTRFTFTTDQGPAVTNPGGGCGRGLVLTVGGEAQLPLATSEELARAIDAALGT